MCAYIEYPHDARCGHASHQMLSVETIKAICLNEPGVDANSSEFWRRAPVFMERILKEQPVRFSHGPSCFSDLIENMSKLTLPHMNEILSVGSGVALQESYLADKVLGAKIFHVTDIKPPHNLVEKLSCVEAIEKYNEADTLMFTYPCYADSGYEGVVRQFKGKYIIMVGEIEIDGHTNPGDLLEQILEDCEKVVHVDMRRCTRSYGCHESLILYRKR